MRVKSFKSLLIKSGLAASVLLLSSGAAFAQQQVNLTAAPSNAALPDGTSVPMWGYSCGAVVSGSTATCASLNPAATGWSPVVIRVASGQSLTINLTNSLSFSNSNSVPTSLVIVGQLGGGLGNSATSTPSPDHSQAQANVTWPIAGAASNPGVPPTQGNRVQSFATEVAAGTTAALTWTTPRPGTYLIESGTHPSIQGPMGLYGILVVTCAPGDTSGCAAGTAYPNVSYNADVALLMSEIDAVQNNAVNTAVNTAGFSEATVWSGLPGGCGNPASSTFNTCYPPAVNYSPRYYLINGVGFDKTNPSASVFQAAPGSAATPVAGSVLVRLVNAGLKMHVPAIVGSQATTFAPVTNAASTANGLALIAEDGNPLPGIRRVQNEVFMAAGKTYDVMVNVPGSTAAALPVYDRELSLSGNAISRDAGMLAYIGVNGSVQGVSSATAVANADSYAVVPGQTLTVGDVGKGVIANDVNVYGVKVSTAPTQGTLTLNANGTFSYVPNSGWSGGDSFTYCANNTTTVCATVTLGAATIEAGSGIAMGNATFTSTVATALTVKSPGVLAFDKDAAGYPLTVAASTVSALTGPGTGTLSVDPNGGLNATVSAPGTYTFTYNAQNSQGTQSASAATVTLVFPTGSGLAVTLLDGADKTPITDYRWIIEEDRTFYIDPNCTTNPPPSGCPTFGAGQVPTFGTNFHTSYMPVVATGCVGTLACESGQTVLGAAAVCDVGNGVCRTTGTQQTAVDPSQVQLDPTKRYYISVLPGDAANPFMTGNLGSSCLGGASAAGATNCGHGMGGAPIAAGQTAVTILAQPTPFPPAKLSIFVFEDDWPLNGEVDTGGGVDTLSPQEPGLGGFNITIMDDAGGTGDSTGQVDYDMFNQPLSNSLAGTVDPATGHNACPVPVNGPSTPNGTGITGTIVTCPKYEDDGVTLSPLAGQAVVANMMPGRYGVIATPAADRIARGEEWLQTNTLDGQKAHDSFLRIGEASYFQEYGPAGYHVSIGFANPKIIQSRLAGVCNGTDVNVTLTTSNCDPAKGQAGNTLTGTVTTERMSRTPDERLYSSGSRASFAFTQCYISFGDPDGEDFAFTKCNADGTFTITGLPDGDWRVTTFDQWNDQLVDGLSTPVRLSKGATGGTTNMGDLAANQWQANFNTRTFLDQNGDGISQGSEPGLALVKTNVRYRDGSFSNRNNTDLDGYAAFNEEFPLFAWYVIETDVTRYKNTGTHVVYDAGGPADGTPCGNATSPASAPCGSSTIGDHLANTFETISLPVALRVPGAVYCVDADCSTHPAGIAGGPATSDAPAACTIDPNTGVTNCTNTLSTGRIDPAWVLTEAWQGFSGQNNFLEFGKKPYAAGENGGVRGHVVYASTRPFDDPQFNTQNTWEPMVPGVTINLYQEITAPDGTTGLTLVDTTQTTSWDAWAQGFRSDGVPNMNCPGQLAAPTTSAAGDVFFFTIFNQPMYLDWYNSQHGGPAPTALPGNSQFKCYDGMHNWNQLQPAPYDGMYQFPSVNGRDPVTGNTTGTNCTVCVKDTDSTDPFRFGKEDMLPAGKYVVEVVVPPGYELVKEEDKNILIGDNFIAPAVVEFPGLGSAVYILPDQAEIAAAYNQNNAQNPTNSLGRNQQLTSHEGDTPTIDTFWPCVGAMRTVPDYISLYPQSGEVAPFAGALRPLCDRKEVTLTDQTSSQADFFVFTSAHAAAHFTGIITDDFTSEFDPFSPQFGEKFSPPDLPIAIKDWAGNEISRVYSDQWGAFNGLTYSTWEVNPPNPTGYSPTMMITCMNDPGTGSTPDPLFNPLYSQFCYEIPFMPGATQYMDTPVVPTAAYASAGYNNVDCALPDTTPAIAEVDGDGIGPWIAASGATHPIVIKALGDQAVPNNAYAGPSATTAPYNQKTLTRHYGFGATQGTVTIGGVAATVTGWSDTKITVTAPGNVPMCGIQQQGYYSGGAGNARCGEITITAANGKKTLDTVTLTIGGKAPTHVTSTAPLTTHGPGAIQIAINNALPGDLIIVNPGVYQEMLLMWKPVRLQGVGAASSIINANTQPGGKLDPWRLQVNCLMGLAPNGVPPNAASCGAGWAAFGNHPTGRGVAPDGIQVDRLPLEAVVGWDATLNGNLAELLQEPSLMGAFEGAGITVLGKGAKFPTGGAFLSDTFPVDSTLLTVRDCTSAALGLNPYPSNFLCNPSRIDGLGITDSSQGGGAIFAHAWAHGLEISNNRIYNNSGTLAGGINVGQGEFPPAYVVGSIANASPGSCETSFTTNVQLPYCFNQNVNIHNNNVSLNSSIGDELFSSSPAGAGGVSIATGADNYKLTNNWVCGNMSTGDGGGVSHMGFSYNGDIEHNAILFNQSSNPTVPTNGGGIMVMGAPDTDPVCSLAPDGDCAPGTSDGTGPNLVINGNLIMGNTAESGSGGAIRLQGVNGTDVGTFPKNPSRWYQVTITNNIIANNVAGWDGAGISLLDAVNVNVVNNTVIDNDTTASAGVLFNTLGAPIASSSGPTCTQNCGTGSQPQPSGLVAIQHSAPLLATIQAAGSALTCPANHPGCAAVSYPYLANDVFWENRAFFIGVGALGGGTLNQQNVVALYNAFTGTSAVSQPQTDATVANGAGVIVTGGTGACTNGASYWDIGVRGDTGPSNHGSGTTLAPSWSVLTDAADYPGHNNFGTDPQVVSQYCNGSRVPPELGSMGYQVPPGISDATVPNPVFNLTPAATVDEGNNWINLSWGPLTLSNPVSNAPLGNYSPAAGSPAVNAIPVASASPLTPKSDYFGNPRPAGCGYDVGAVELTGPVASSISPNVGFLGQVVNVTITGANLTGATGVTVSGSGVTVGALTVNAAGTQITTTFTIAANAATNARSVTVTTPLGSTCGALTFTVEGATLTRISPNTGSIGTAVQVTLTGTHLNGATAVNVSGSGVTVGALNINGAGTTITTTFTIAANAAATARSVTVTPVGGVVTNAETFTVEGSAVTGISPNTGLRGTTVPVVLTGVNLGAATAVNVSGAGVTVGAFTVNGAGTQISTNFTIAVNAPATARSVTVTLPGAVVIGPVTFTVDSPVVNTIAPNTGNQGASVPVTLTGVRLNGATAVTVSGAGVTAGPLTVNGAGTSVTTTLTIAPGAAAGARGVTVTVPGGAVSAPVTFTVEAPTLTAIAPATGTHGTTVNVTLTGTHLTGASAVNVTGGGITVGSLTVNGTGTSLTTSFTIAGNAATTARAVTVTVDGVTTGPRTFTVQ